MEIKIIDENSGNPFEYFPDDGSPEINFPRSYKKPENIEKVMKGLVSKLGIKDNPNCLEVGAGHKPYSSNALSKLGANVVTLDADWQENHTDIPLEEYRKMMRELGKDLVIPRIAGKNGKVVYYLGDIAFINHERSALRNKEFDFIYFWGSMYHTGICNSVEDSSTPEELGVDIKFQDRILKIISAIKYGGTLLSLSDIFSGHMDEKEIGYIKHMNICLADSILYLATAGEKKSKSIGFIGQTNDAVSKKFKDFIAIGPFEQIIQLNYYSLFGEDNGYRRLKEALENISSEDRRRITNIGMIDAVFAEY